MLIFLGNILRHVHVETSSVPIFSSRSFPDCKCQAQVLFQKLGDAVCNPQFVATRKNRDRQSSTIDNPIFLGSSQKKCRVLLHPHTIPIRATVLPCLRRWPSLCWQLSKGHGLHQARPEMGLLHDNPRTRLPAPPSKTAGIHHGIWDAESWRN